MEAGGLPDRERLPPRPGATAATTTTRRNDRGRPEAGRGRARESGGGPILREDAAETRAHRLRCRLIMYS